MVKDAFHTSSAKEALQVISESVQGKPSAGRWTYEHKQVKDDHRKVRTAVPRQRLQDPWQDAMVYQPTLQSQIQPASCRTIQSTLPDPISEKLSFHRLFLHNQCRITAEPALHIRKSHIKARTAWNPSENGVLKITEWQDNGLDRCLLVKPIFLVFDEGDFNIVSQYSFSEVVLKLLTENL